MFVCILMKYVCLILIRIIVRNVLDWVVVGCICGCVWFVGMLVVVICCWIVMWVGIFVILVIGLFVWLSLVNVGFGVMWMKLLWVRFCCNVMWGVVVIWFVCYLLLVLNFGWFGVGYCLECFSVVLGNGSGFCVDCFYVLFLCVVVYDSVCVCYWLLEW